jgi:3-hydroxyisobutyrate dehydrogenase-like beta-hydroxyacid dehydrogenase
MTTVAVVGLGTMGSRIARRLLETGHDVVVWNRTAAKAAELVERGAVAAGSAAEAAREAEAVVTTVSDAQALRDVSEGGAGLAAGATAGTTVIQMSTVGPSGIARLESVLPVGTGLLDAPVLGSVAEVESGSLKIFVGGPEPLVERWTRTLSALGSLVYVGPVGAGTAAKLVAQLTLFGALAALDEAIVLGRELDLPLDVTLDVLAVTPLAAQAERRRPSLESGEYPPRFSLSLARKDANMILDVAAAAGADVRLAAAARAWLADAEEAGLGASDYSAVLAHMLGSRRKPPDSDRRPEP